VPAPRPALAQEPEPPRRFDVNEYVIEGNTALPVVAVERAVYPHLGPQRTIDDVERARASLEQAYRAAGFPSVIVDVPQQQVKDGVVMLQVTEGKVSRTRVVGARYYSQGRILEKLPAVAEGSVLSTAELQEQLGDVNRGSGLRVEPVLRAGRIPGTTEVDLRVQDEFPLHGALELNNRYSPNTSALRLVGTLRYDNLFQRRHSLSFQYQTSPQDWSEVRVWSAAYTVPFASGWFLTGYYVDSQSGVATAIAGSTFLGNGRIYGLRATVPLPSVRDGFFHSATLGIDHKDFQDNLVQPGLPPLPTPISYTPLIGAYSATWFGTGRRTTAGASLSFALRGVSSEATEFENKRFRAQENFVVLRGELEHERVLPEKWVGWGRVDGQLSSQPLVSNEQYVAGGIFNVRGYLEATALGDNAIRGSAELRTPNQGARLSDRIDDLRGVVFVDSAHLTIRDALPGQQASTTLLGAGFGLRLRAYNALRVQADLGWPMRDAFATKAWDPRFQFIANVAF
jgi:hemolysin activation/secretion protein